MISLTLLGSGIVAYRQKNELHINDQVSISSAWLQSTFMHEDLNSAKNTTNLSVFFTLLGSAHVKAARKMLMKYITGVNFTNMFTSSFYLLRSQRYKNTVKLTVFLCFWDLCVQKLQKDFGEIDPRCQFHHHEQLFLTESVLRTCVLTVLVCNFLC